MTATQFLEKFRPGGPWILVAIPVDQKGIETVTFTDLAGVPAWIEKNRLCNLYFHVNPATRHLTNKAAKTDIAELAWLHVDIDWRVGESPAGEKARVRLAIENYPRRPTCVIFSGGGFQCFWRARTPLPINGDLAAADDAARYNIQLELDLGGDDCHDVSRIMRLPGTTNWPNAKKRERGRVKAEAEVTWFEDTDYDIPEAFLKAERLQAPGEGLTGSTVQVSGNVAKVNVLELPVKDWVKVVIIQGNRPDGEEPYPSDSEALFAVLCEMIRSDCDDDTMYSVIMDSEFGVSRHILKHGSGASNAAIRQIGRARDQAIDPWLLKLNDRYGVLMNCGGKCRVIEEIDELKRKKLTLISFPDFKNAWCNVQIQVGTKQGRNGVETPVYAKLGAWWLDHPKRRQYSHMIFAPGHEVPGAYNLWRGFAVDARAGDCSMYLEHILKNVCGGRQDYFDYLIRWMARAVQDPGSPGRTAMVMRGPEGAGKGFFVQQFGKLFGRHFLHVSNSKHLVGDFNAHLHDCVVLFADEAFWAGDKKNQSVLKTLITEEMNAITYKGIDTQMARNCVHLVIASNEDWVVPVGIGDRRFFVLDVGEEHVKDLKYFKAIAQQMQGGGSEALLHYLINLDLDGFDVERIPQTEAHLTQKILSMPADQEWWFNKLKDGRLAPVDEGWTCQIPAHDLVFDFALALRQMRTQRSNETLLAHLLKRMTDGKARKVRVCESRKVKMVDGSQVTIAKPYFWLLPSLMECRDQWDKVNFNHEWHDAPEEPGKDPAF